MDIPRFELGRINPRLIERDIGDAFQRFAHEALLSEYPELHAFPTGGKDGGIDATSSQETRVVIECKYIASSDYGDILKRWRSVEGHLARHITTLERPPPGQSQYRPWYSTNPPIREYIFCISTSFGNADQKDQLEITINTFFKELGRANIHLRHLTELSTKVVDWNDFAVRLRRQPHLTFRWFPSSRPIGFVPLEENVDAGTFRGYLTHSTLPYYSLADHLRSFPAPKGVTVLDENQILGLLDDPDKTGLVITGKGGVGKTRLALELARLALARGWTVLRVVSRLREDSFDRLAERLSPTTPVLLVLDYLETQDDFTDLAEHLGVINDMLNLRVRYVATCRTSSYSHIVSVGRQVRVDITPSPGAAALEWFRHFRTVAVRTILSHSTLDVTKHHIDVCRDLPILAVFILYLYGKGRHVELADLLAENDFGRWVSKRIELAFPGAESHRELARLIALFPMLSRPHDRASLGSYQSLLDTLATDGWIERVAAKQTGPYKWVVAHDVIADQILLSYVAGIPNTVEPFVNELLAVASQLGHRSSAIASLQRVRETTLFNTIDWKSILDCALCEDPKGWRVGRLALMRTTLLSFAERLILLCDHPEVFAGSETSRMFQKEVALLLRSATKHGLYLSSEQWNRLQAWMDAAVANDRDSGEHILSAGLTMAPRYFQAAAASWIENNAQSFTADYMMVAWLRGGLNPEEIAKPLRTWVGLYGTHRIASFLLTAWLAHGGGKKPAWSYALKWLSLYHQEAAAVFVITAIAKTPDLPVETIRHILAWCRKFCEHEEVLWRFTQLGSNMFTAGVEEAVIATAEILIDCALRGAPDDLPMVARNQITTIISRLCRLAQPLSSPAPERVDGLFARWLKHPNSFGFRVNPHFTIQRTVVLRRLRVLLASGLIDIEADREALQRFMQWLNEWAAKKRGKLVKLVSQLSQDYPAPEVWNMFRVPKIELNQIPIAKEDERA